MSDKTTTSSDPYKCRRLGHASISEMILLPYNFSENMLFHMKIHLIEMGLGNIPQIISFQMLAEISILAQFDMCIGLPCVVCCDSLSVDKSE